MPARLTEQDLPIDSRFSDLIIKSAPYMPLTPLPYVPVSQGGPRLTSLVKVMCVYEEKPGVPCGKVVELKAKNVKGGFNKTCGSHGTSQRRKSVLTRRSYAGENHPCWKGGRKLKNGYVKIWMRGHPNADTKGYVWEHHKVMSDFLGRAIMPGETVHHINGKTDDNRLENLQLRLGHHGPGSAYRCSDCGSERISPVALKDSQEVTVA